MELQIALDFDFEIGRAISILQELEEYVDIIEIGTPFILDCGLLVVKEIKRAFPHKKVLADLKIVDAGYREAENAFLAGADIVTALAVTDDTTIINALNAARDAGKQLMVDMLSSVNLESRIVEIDAMGVDYICLHTSKDLQRIASDASVVFSKLRQSLRNSKLAIAGGINEASISKYVKMNPDIVIVGEGITITDDPKKSCKNIKSYMQKDNHK